jgi:hypothetical protein
MAQVTFTPNIQRHVRCPTSDVAGDTVREVLDAVFADNPHARTYVLDDQGAVRRHMVIFVDGKPVTDRQSLTDPVAAHAEVFVMQALSGG